MTINFESLTINQLAACNAELQSKYQAVVDELDQVSNENTQLKLALTTAMESVTNSLHVLRVETERSNALAVENAQLRAAIEFATAPDMWVEQHDGMLDYRYTEWYVDVLNTALETPVTEAAITEIKAQGVEDFAKLMHADISESDALEFAQQLRKESAIHEQ
ncbi:hypothetical protein [Klebsiella sp. BIGb0407]|uniref:hypothetical protein n=1 Tax=Klebsiella sp. BIGb0407 TaxID=2940603 RepID=UPI0021681A2A|nr:hypothetical protein [Klebsiella sp. BIGb0407]MCS3430054.1 uncharacterized protein (DUF433 family) [Klebsiella sp. BIGb0407]